MGACARTSWGFPLKDATRSHGADPSMRNAGPGSSPAVFVMMGTNSDLLRVLEEVAEVGGLEAPITSFHWVSNKTGTLADILLS